MKTSDLVFIMTMAFLSGFDAAMGIEDLFTGHVGRGVFILTIGSVLGLVYGVGVAREAAKDRPTLTRHLSNEAMNAAMAKLPEQPKLEPSSEFEQPVIPVRRTT